MRDSEEISLPVSFFLGLRLRLLWLSRFWLFYWLGRVGSRSYLIC